MKNIIFYIPYIPILGLIIVSIICLIPYINKNYQTPDYCIDFRHAMYHFYASYTVQYISFTFLYFNLC